MATLAELVQSLPQELFDRIVNYTFATPDLDDQEPAAIDDTKVQVVIDKNYKPPFHLQINRATRIAFAEKYYHNVLFVTPHPSFYSIPYKWANSLTDTHRNAVRFMKFKPYRRQLVDVVVEVTRTNSRHPESSLDGLTAALRNGWGSRFPSSVGIYIYPGYEAEVSPCIEEEHGNV